MKIDTIRVYGFAPALHGMRNPMDSWDDADSIFYEEDGDILWETPGFGLIRTDEAPIIGEKDMALACKLIRRGSEHRKFLRQIMVWVRLTVPRFVWQEVDTYKVATTRNSCSTMNKLGSTDLDQHDFEVPITPKALEDINVLGRALRNAKEGGCGVKGARVQLKNDLPEGFLQAAMYTMSYETALTMLLQRENHRLPQWRLSDMGSICQFLMALPYMSQFYRAATWKRDERRGCVRTLMEMASRENNLQIKLEELEELANRLRKAI